MKAKGQEPGVRGQQPAGGGRKPMEAAACSFCGLPAPQAAGNEPAYCCYGCRFAASIAAANGDEGQARWAMTRLGLAVFFSMNVMVFTMLLWSQDQAIGSAGASPTPAGALPAPIQIWYDLGRYTCLLFTVPVLLLLGGPLIADAAAELRRGRASISLLLLVGVAAAMGYSVYSLTNSGHVYFEVACTILVAVTLGRWLEATGKLKTTEALRGLAKLLPDHVRLLQGDVERRIPAAELDVGDAFRVLPGERIAADGQIERGEAAVDEQAVTGESIAQLRQEGNRALSGTLVLDGPLVIRASSRAGEGTLARMIAAVQQATAARSRYERLAERLSRWFLPAIALIAIATFAGHCWLTTPGQGLLAAVAVLVIACPCALGLATPMALWTAIGRAAQAGVLIREGDALSQLAAAKSICFDKTGTLTTGDVQVTAFLDASPRDRIFALDVAGALATGSTHPLAAAIDRFASDRGSSSVTADSMHTWPGRGLTGNIPGILGPAYLGSLRWLAECGQHGSFPIADDSAESFVAWEGRIHGRFACAELLRPALQETLNALQQLGLQTIMLTGDRRERAARIAAELGLQSRAELLPEAKLTAIRELQQAGPVVMVGDGLNDAPALAAADVGIALGSGTDISRHTAAVCLLQSDLARLPWLFALSQQTVHTIRWNLVWALAYNVCGIALAAAGCLHPIIAAIAMGASSLLVVANSLRLASFADAETASPRRSVSPPFPLAAQTP